MLTQQISDRRSALQIKSYLRTRQDKVFRKRYLSMAWIGPRQRLTTDVLAGQDAYVFIGSFIWYWFPGWIAQFLSFFLFATWIAPNNVVVNQIFGGNSGLGIIPITFDWTIVSGYLQSPLIPPWFAIGNSLIGLFIFVILSAIGVQYTGSWFTDHLPLQSSKAFDNTGGYYNVSSRTLI